MKTAIALTVALFTLSACGAIPAGLFGEPVPGLTTVKMDADGSFKGNFGKEYQKISGTFARPDGMAGSFNAEGVEAFPGQAIQAGLQVEMMKMMQSMMQAIAPLLTGALSGGATGLPLQQRPRPQ